MSDEGTSLGDDYECKHGCGTTLSSPTDLQSHMKKCDGDGVPDGYDDDGTPKNYHPDSEFETADTMSQNDNTEQAEDSAVQNNVESNYDAAWVGNGTYVATNGADVFTVELNGDDGPSVEEHDEYHPAVHEAISRHHDSPDLEHSIMLEWAGIIRDAENTLQTAESALEGAEEANVTARAVQADAEHEAANNNSNTTQNGGTSGSNSDVAYNSDVDAEEAAAELDDAFMNAGIGGINVTEEAGLVWLNVTPDAPEKVAGNDTWETLLRNPDQTIWVPDGSNGNDRHDWADHTPGDYYQNCLKPEDVDQYIEEILGVFL